MVGNDLDAAVTVSLNSSTVPMVQEMVTDTKLPGAKVEVSTETTGPPVRTVPRELLATVVAAVWATPVKGS